MNEKSLRIIIQKTGKETSNCHFAKNIRKVFEAAYVLTGLINKWIELIYFDEFTINTRHLQFKRWTPRGRKGFVKLQKEWFAMSFIVALSEYKIYSIMGSKETINTKTIKHYV